MMIREYIVQLVDDGSDSFKHSEDELLMKYGAEEVEKSEKWTKVLPSLAGFTNTFECPKCKEWAEYKYKTRVCSYKFCPNCGAKMGGDSDDNS